MQLKTKAVSRNKDYIKYAKLRVFAVLSFLYPCIVYEVKCVSNDNFTEQYLTTNLDVATIHARCNYISDDNGNNNDAPGKWSMYFGH